MLLFEQQQESQKFMYFINCSAAINIDNKWAKISWITYYAFTRMLYCINIPNRSQSEGYSQQINIERINNHNFNSYIT